QAQELVGRRHRAVTRQALELTLQAEALVAQPLLVLVQLVEGAIATLQLAAMLAHLFQARHGQKIVARIEAPGRIEALAQPEALVVEAAPLAVEALQLLRPLAMSGPAFAQFLEAGREQRMGQDVELV